MFLMILELGSESDYYLLFYLFYVFLISSIYHGAAIIGSCCSGYPTMLVQQNPLTRTPKGNEKQFELARGKFESKFDPGENIVSLSKLTQFKLVGFTESGANKAKTKVITLAYHKRCKQHTDQSEFKTYTSAKHWKMCLRKLQQVFNLLVVEKKVRVFQPTTEQQDKGKVKIRT